eukprot:jgi/Undpi1/11844/HiC_scaffold_4.g01543.m1
MKFTASVFLGGAACASAFVGTPVSTRAALKSSMVTMSSSGNVDQLTRVDAIKTAAATAVAAGAVFSGAFPAAADGPYVLPDLPYPYESLEPYIDAATMKVLWWMMLVLVSVGGGGIGFVFWIVLVVRYSPAYSPPLPTGLAPFPTSRAPSSRSSLSSTPPP